MPAISSSHDPSELLQQLLRLDRRARLVALFNGLGLAALLVAGVIATALVADAFWEAPLALRMGLLAVTAIAAVGGCLWAVARALWRRSDPAAAAALVESAYPELHERLSSAIEFEQGEASSGSPLMRALVARQAEQSLRGLDLAAPLPILRTTRRGTLGAAVLAALLAPCLFFGGYRLLLARFATPWRNLERAANLYFDVTPGDATVSRGADVEITAAPQWRVAQTQIDSAWLHWQDARGNRFERQMTWQPERSTYSATVAHVLQPFDFEIAAGRTRTRAFHIDVVDRAVLSSVSAIIEPPAYTGHAVEQIAGAIGELEMLQGSHMLLQMQFSLPVERAELQWQPDAAPDAAAPESTTIAATLSADHLAATVEMSPEESGRFALQLYDAVGLVNADEPHRRVRVIPDAPPTVVFTGPNVAPSAGPRDVLRLPVAADDDIGLSQLELHFEVVGNDQQTGQIDSGMPLLGVRSAEHEFTLDLDPLELNEGAIVSVRARATDERPVPGPNESWTEPRLITISEQTDPYESESVAQRQQQLAQTLQRLRAEVAQNQMTTEQLQSHAAAQQSAGAAFERDAELAALADADRETVAEAERLAALFDLHPLLLTLGERTRAVAHDQLASASEQSQQAAAVPPADKSGALAAAAGKLAEASAELEALQRDLESLADLEQDLLELQRLADDADRLAKDVASLEESTAEARETDSAESPDDEAKLQALAADRLRSDHSDLSARLDNLLDRRPELLDAALEHDLDQLDALREHALRLAARERTLSAALEQETEPANPAEESSAAQEELAARQAELVQRAAELALSAAETSPSDAAQLEELAGQAARAAEAADSGDLAAAAAAAQQAAEQAAAAAQAERATDPSAGGETGLAELAADQQAAAQQFAEAAASPQARAAARQQSQRELAESAQQLEQMFNQIAEQLTSEPLNRSEEGARATESSAATQQAQDSMEASAAAQSRGEMPAAATAAEDAAAQLELAAEQARAATEQTPDSPVPTDVGQQVAQASRQLRRAGDQLNDAPQSTSESEGIEGTDAEAANAAAGEQQQAGADSPMPEANPENGPADASGESGSSDAQGSDLAQAAAALQAAAQRLKPRSPGDSQPTSESAMGQQPGGEPAADSSADGGGTAETARLTELAAKIKARSMRNWGELPGELQSELQQRSHSRPDADYAPLIRMYFDEISRRQSPTLDDAP